MERRVQDTAYDQGQSSACGWAQGSECDQGQGSVWDQGQESVTPAPPMGEISTKLEENLMQDLSTPPACSVST